LFIRVRVTARAEKSGRLKPLAQDVLATAQDENSRITVLECYHFLHTRCFTSLKQASEQGTVDGQACPECKKRLSFA